MSTAYFVPSHSAQSASVDVNVARSYEGQMPPWLMTINIGPEHHSTEHVWSYPQSRAVVDDFGTLVAVRAWK